MIPLADQVTLVREHQCLVVARAIDERVQIPQVLVNDANLEQQPRVRFGGRLFDARREAGLRIDLGEVEPPLLIRTAVGSENRLEGKRLRAGKRMLFDQERIAYAVELHGFADGTVDNPRMAFDAGRDAADSIQPIERPGDLAWRRRGGSDEEHRGGLIDLQLRPGRRQPARRGIDREDDDVARALVRDEQVSPARVEGDVARRTAQCRKELAQRQRALRRVDGEHRNRVGAAVRDVEEACPLVDLDFGGRVPSGEPGGQRRNLLNLDEAPLVDAEDAHLRIGFMVHVEKPVVRTQHQPTRPRAGAHRDERRNRRCESRFR